MYFLVAFLATAVVERPDLAVVFAEHGTPGTFVLYDVSGGRSTVVDGARAERRYVPASTFKIANSLIALESGAVKDEREVIPYGGAPQPFPQWERDMDMRDAIRASSVPVYQEIARRIGPKRMQAYLNRLRYGNRKIGKVIDRFWLDGPLQISALEQARFVARLAQGKLPLSERSQRTVREHPMARGKGRRGPFRQDGLDVQPAAAADRMVGGLGRAPGAGLRVRAQHRHGLGGRHAEAHRHRPVSPRAAGRPATLMPRTMRELARP